MKLQLPIMLGLAICTGTVQANAINYSETITAKAHVITAGLLNQNEAPIQRVDITHQNNAKIYRRPAGMLNSQFMIDGHWWKNSTFIGQPNRPMTFKIVDAYRTSKTTYSWNMGTTLENGDMQLIMGENTYSNTPVVTSNEDGSLTTYQHGCIGGDNRYYPSWIYSYCDIQTSGYYEIGTAKSFMSSGDPARNTITSDGQTVINDQLDMTLAVDGKEGQFWFGKNDTYNMCGEAFEKPENPYVLRSVYVLYRHSADNDVEAASTMQCTGTPTLTVYVYKLDEIPAYDATKSVTPTLGDLIATGTATLDQSKSVPSAAYGGENDGLMVYPLNFTLKDANGNTIQPEIDFPYIVLVTGYDNENVKRFEIPVSADTYDDGFGELGYLGNIKDGKVTEINGINNLLSIGACKTAPAIAVDVYNPYINYANESGTAARVKEKSFTADGGQDEVTVATSFSSTSDLFITTEDGQALPSYITTSVAAAGTKQFKVTINVAKSTEAERTQNIKIRTNGDYVLYKLTQESGATAVSEVNTDANTAYYTAGKIVVNTEKNQTVSIYSVSGALVANANIVAGENTISVENLATGIYLVQFENGKVLKIAK